MALANLLLAPTRASQALLETLLKVNELIGLARSLNPETIDPAKGNAIAMETTA